MNRTSCVLACITAFAGVGTSHAFPQHPISTNLCEVLSSPSDWNNKIVSLAAAYFIGGFDGPVIVDEHCENGIVEISFMKHTTSEDELETAIPRNSLGTFDHTVTGTWIGRFHSNYGKFHETFLDVQAIRHLTVSPIDFSSSDASPIRTTLKDIVAQPKVFDRKTVVVDAEFMTDAMHGSMVFECGAHGMGPGILIRRISGARGEDTLDHALQQGHLATLDKTIRAEWTGRLSSLPNPVRGGYEIQITAIRNLAVVMHPDALPCGMVLPE
jgi:hypothetical protein